MCINEVCESFCDEVAVLEIWSLSLKRAASFSLLTGASLPVHTNTRLDLEAPEVDGKVFEIRQRFSSNDDFLLESFVVSRNFEEGFGGFDGIVRDHGVCDKVEWSLAKLDHRRCSEIWSVDDEERLAVEQLIELVANFAVCAHHID